MLKSIIRIAASVLGAALLLAGCAKQPDPASAEGNNPISFDAGSPLLRDDVTKASTPPPSGTHIGVFAYLQPGTVGSPGVWNNTRTPDLMFNQDVYYNGSTYTYSPTRFWPATGTTISFWAYCPYSSATVFKATNGSAYTRTTTGWPDMQFSVTDGSTDLLSTNKMTSLTRPANNTVSLTLRHRLSKISVNICKQDPSSRYTVTLKTIRFDGIYMTADIRPDVSWRNYSNRDNFPVYTDAPDDNTDDVVLTTSMQAVRNVMLIPQDLNYENAKLHVEYSISYSGILHERTNAWELPLSEVFTDNSSKWTANKHYTLNLTVVPDDPIEFTVSWSDWGDVYDYHITS